MRSVIETKDYILNFEEGICTVKATGIQTKASKEIMVEIARSTWREEKQNQTFSKRVLFYNNPSEEGEHLDHLPGNSAFEPENIVMQKETRDLYVKALKMVKPKIEDVASLYFWDGLTETEISKKLGITHQAVNYRKKVFVEIAKKIAGSSELEGPCLIFI